jgi:hypothetical protein
MAITGSQLNLNAQDSAPVAVAEKEGKKEKSYPFNGTLKGIDKDAGTVKVSNRTFKLTTKTQYLQGSVDDAKIGEKVGGSYWKRNDGTLEVRSIRFGPKPKKEKKKSSE